LGIDVDLGGLVLLPVVVLPAAVDDVPEAALYERGHAVARCLAEVKKDLAEAHFAHEAVS
jgi:hypothetical protein